MRIGRDMPWSYVQECVVTSQLANVVRHSSYCLNASGLGGSMLFAFHSLRHIDEHRGRMSWPAAAYHVRPDQTGYFRQKPQAARKCTGTTCSSWALLAIKRTGALVDTCCERCRVVLIWKVAYADEDSEPDEIN